MPSLHLLCKSKLSPNKKRFEMRVHARGPIKVVNCSQLFNLGWEWGFPGGASGNEPKSPSASAAEVGDAGSVLAGKIPWRRRRQPAPVFLPGESHGQRSLAGHSPRDCRVGHDSVTELTVLVVRQLVSVILFFVCLKCLIIKRLRKNKPKSNTLLRPDTPPKDPLKL